MIRKEKLDELNKYIDLFRTKSLKEISNPKFISVKRYLYKLNNGCEVTREEILKNCKSGNASVILPITKDNNVILVIQPRVFTKQGVLIELPAGYVEDGEDASISAKRELEEETGYISKKLELVNTYYQDQGCSKALISSYIAYECEKVKEQNLDRDEYIKYFECTYEEILELVDKGYIKDVNSLLLIEKSRQLVKRR